MKNTTTIEGWEKDKAAVLVRRGKIKEVRKHASIDPHNPSHTWHGQIKFPYVCALFVTLKAIAHPKTEPGETT